MKTPALALLPLLVLGACQSAGSTADVRAPGALDFMKSLAGSWVPLDEHGQPGAEVTNVFRVTAGGSAVEETVLPGTGHEMVTLYFERDGEVQLTHYCVLGNQPHMIAQPAQGPNAVEFVCDGSGVVSEEDGHMHHARFELAPDGTLTSRWQMVAHGQDTDRVEFHLTRKK